MKMRLYDFKAIEVCEIILLFCGVKDNEFACLQNTKYCSNTRYNNFSLKIDAGNHPGLSIQVCCVVISFAFFCIF